MNKIEFNISIICELVFGVIKDWNDKKIKKKINAFTLFILIIMMLILNNI
jgi:hypothetical protein